MRGPGLSDTMDRNQIRKTMTRNDKIWGLDRTKKPTNPFTRLEKILVVIEYLVITIACLIVIVFALSYILP